MRALRALVTTGLASAGLVCLAATPSLAAVAPVSGATEPAAPAVDTRPPPAALDDETDPLVIDNPDLIPLAEADSSGTPAADTDPHDVVLTPESYELIPPTELSVVRPVVVSANERFIADAYLALLGRAADEAGQAYNLALMDAGGAQARETFAYSLAFSAEGSGRQVVWAYDDILGRAPDTGGAQYWTSHLQGHGVTDLRVLLLASDEYVNRAGGTDGAWIDALYLDVLGRGADADGRQYWLDRAGAGVPRPLIAASVYLSDESLGRRVQSLYTDVLGRAATNFEQASGVVFARATDERNLRARLLATDEAFAPYGVSSPV